MDPICEFDIHRIMSRDLSEADHSEALAQALLNAADGFRVSLNSRRSIPPGPDELYLGPTMGATMRGSGKALVIRRVENGRFAAYWE